MGTMKVKGLSVDDEGSVFQYKNTENDEILFFDGEPRQQIASGCAPINIHFLYIIFLKFFIGVQGHIRFCALILYFVEK